MASIRKRTLPSGKIAWQCAYVDQSGKRRSKQFKTRKEADSWLVNARSEISRGVHTPESASITVADAAALWIERCEREGLEESTIRQYEQHRNLHIVPLIGAQKLSRLTYPDIEAFVDKLIDTRSRAMARRVLTSLKSIISEAQRRGLVAQNVARDAKVIVRRGEETPVQIPSKADVRTMLEKVSDKWRPLLATAVFTGMRSSELRGLSWPHVDLERSVIKVRQRADFRGRMGPPKSKAGIRDIPMAPIVLNALRAWKLACPPSPHGLVFPSDAGTPYDPANLMGNFFIPLQEKCELTRDGRHLYRLHDLRHFAASIFIEHGWGPKKVQSVMGHSTIATTYDVYGHLFPSEQDDKAAMKAIETHLLGSKTASK